MQPPHSPVSNEEKLIKATNVLVCSDFLSMDPGTRDRESRQTASSLGPFLLDLGFKAPPETPWLQTFVPPVPFLQSLASPTVVPWHHGPWDFSRLSTGGLAVIGSAGSDGTSSADSCSHYSAVCG